jgi:hypothetical protein
VSVVLSISQTAVAFGMRILAISVSLVLKSEKPGAEGRVSRNVENGK